jgi:hypothetical protein
MLTLLISIPIWALALLMLWRAYLRGHRGLPATSWIVSS